MKLPRARYEELASAPGGMPCPSWTAEAARRAFGLDLTERRLAEAVLVRGPDRVWMIDWAWPTRGAAFIDAGCFLIRAMAAGHSASQAEALAAECPGLAAGTVRGH